MFFSPKQVSIRNYAKKIVLVTVVCTQGILYQYHITTAVLGGFGREYIVLHILLCIYLSTSMSWFVHEFSLLILLVSDVWSPWISEQPCCRSCDRWRTSHTVGEWCLIYTWISEQPCCRSCDRWRTSPPCRRWPSRCWCPGSSDLHIRSRRFVKK